MLEKSFFYQEILHKGREEGRLQERLSSIELSLEVKFGMAGLELISAISQISDLELLRTIHKDILSVNNLDELRELIHNIHVSELN